MKGRLVAVLLMTVGLAGGSARAADPAARCAARKFKAASQASEAVLRCEAAAARAGATVDAGCLTAAEAKLSEKVAIADAAGGCVASGNAAAIAARLVSLGADLQSAVHPGAAASLCAARKLTLVARTSKIVLAARGGNLLHPNPGALQARVVRQHEKLTFAFAVLESQGGCPTFADAGNVLARLETAVGQVAGEIIPVCGDDVAGGTEACDGVEDGTCPGLCRNNCTCAAPGCGNGILETGESCDGLAGLSCSMVGGFGFQCGAPASASPCTCCVAAGASFFCPSFCPGVPCCTGGTAQQTGLNTYSCSS